MLQLMSSHLRPNLRKLLLSLPKRVVRLRRRKHLKLKLLLLQRSPKHLLLQGALLLSHSFLLRKEKDGWVIVICDCYTLIPNWIMFSNLESCFDVFLHHQRFLWQGFGKGLLHDWKIPKTHLLCWQPSMKLICEFHGFSNCGRSIEHCHKL